MALIVCLTGLSPRVDFSGSSGFAHAQSNITIAVIDPSPGSRWKQNEPIRFQARIEQDGNIVKSVSSHLTAVMRFPPGLDHKPVDEKVPLYDDGEASHGDEAAGDGTRNNLLTPKASGECQVVWKAEVNGKDYYHKEYTITVEPAPVTLPPPEPGKSSTTEITPSPQESKGQEVEPQQKPVPPPPPPSPPLHPRLPAKHFPWWLLVVFPGGVCALVVAVSRARVAHRKLPPLELIATVINTETKESRSQTFVFPECGRDETVATAATLGSSTLSDFVLDDSSVQATHASVERTGASLFLIPVDKAEVELPDGRTLFERTQLALGQEYRIGFFTVAFRVTEVPQTGDEYVPDTTPEGPSPSGGSVSDSNGGGV